jgi:hypothetical protein
MRASVRSIDEDDGEKFMRQRTKRVVVMLKARHAQENVVASKQGVDCLLKNSTGIDYLPTWDLEEIRRACVRFGFEIMKRVECLRLTTDYWDY